MSARFANRRDAGRRLADMTAALREEHPVVLGLPRGGVPVAAEVARALGAPLDVLIVRKLGVPHHPELGMGAVGEGGTRVLNEAVVRAARVTEGELAAVEAAELREVERRAQRYRGRRPMEPVRGRTVIIVDDGLATGGTARAAVETVRNLGAARVVLAVPVAAPEAARLLAAVGDEVIALHTPRSLLSIGEWYADFSQTSDEEVVALLEAARAGRGEGSPRATGSGVRATEVEVSIRAGGATLTGDLSVPENAPGIVVFAHGSGSSRLSPRNVAVARVLNDAGLGTLLFDLLTEREARDRTYVFDIPFLAARLEATTTWLRTQPGWGRLPVGYFGASTGAGAALWAAAAPGAEIAAVVSRGGRPDLAGPRLAAVRAPTLLIVGSNDHVVLDLNREAARQLTCEHRIEVVPGATHLFEEPGTLERASRLATDWFTRYLHRSAESTRRPA
jgi:predicted phosphoribosyltransferase/dienelactone hydrolase